MKKTLCIKNIIRTGYSNFVNDLFENHKYKYNADYYEIDNYLSEYGDMFNFIFKYEFDDVLGEIEKDNDKYIVYVINGNKLEKIGYVPYDSKIESALEIPHEILIKTNCGKGKQILYYSDKNKYVVGDEQFYDYSFFCK